MATFKKSAKKSAGSKASTAQAAEGLGKTLSESAQHIWLAGMGAFGRAQNEGTKLFEALVKEGMNLEQTARKLAGGQADVVRGAVESTVGQARERAADTWDRLEKVFEDRVQRALTKLGVPGRDDLNELSRRVDALTAELRKANGGKSASTTKPRTTAKAGAGKAAKATKAAKAPAKRVSKRQPKAPRAS